MSFPFGKQDRRNRIVTRPLPGSLRFMGGSSGGSTTQTTTATPPTFQIPYITGQAGGVYGAPGANNTAQGIEGLLPAANALYNNQANWPGYFPSATYAPTTAPQQNAINSIYNYGMAGGGPALQTANSSLANMLSPAVTAQTQGPFDATQGYLNQSIGGQGVNQTQGAFNQNQGYLGSLLAGQGVNQTQNQFNQGQNYLGGSIAGQGVGQTQGAFNSGQNYLQGMLNGNSLNPFTAPGFQNVINGTLANVIPATSASFIKGGRSDSGLAQAAQTSAATNAIGSLANQNYLQEQGLQQQAAGLASNNQLAQQQMQQNSVSQAAQNQLAQLQLQQGASGQAAQNQLAQQQLQQGSAGLASNNLLTQQGNQVKAAAIAPLLDQTQGADLQNSLNATGMDQQNQQNLINSAIQQWNYNQTLPFNMLGMYQGYTGGQYGGTSAVQTPYFHNQGANIMGGLAGGAALGSAFGPYGTAAGAAIGGLTAAFSK